MKTTVLLVIVLIAFGGPKTLAQGSCTAYVGRKILPISASTLILKLSKQALRKGEFETTAQFKERQEKSGINLSESSIVNGDLPDQNFLKYDADRQELTVFAYAFANRGVDWDLALLKIEPFGSVPFGTFNLGVSIASVDTPAGTFSGTNAFGVSRRIRRTLRRDVAIFERKADLDEHLFLNQSRDGVLDVLKVNPDEARRLKAAMRFVYVVQPKEPYLATGSRRSEATLDDPEQVELQLNVLIARIECGLMVDADHIVIHAYPTR